MIKSILIRVFIIIIILLIPIYFIFKDYSNSNNVVMRPVVPIVTSTLSPVSNVPLPSVTIVPVDTKSVSKLPIPDLNKTWQIPSGYSVEVKKILNNKIDPLINDLRIDPNHFDKWVNLGILRKTIGDYDEAKNIWEYTASGWPDNIVSYHNLGDLYANYLKDNIGAEKNMLRVVQLDPHYVSDYLALYDLYKRIYGEVGDKTDMILLEGVKNNPESVDLLMTTASHYKEMNNKDSAKKYYNLALTKVEKLKNESLVKLIQLELSNL
ncbi:MAG: tetratricopeptide repeat protein [Candidatus Vogelbacteria bacterium]|nr:tetratricopeptide repeat protein [Candidatus Vogelbacteria bacterium]